MKILECSYEYSSYLKKKMVCVWCDGVDLDGSKKIQLIHMIFSVWSNHALELQWETVAVILAIKVPHCRNDKRLSPKATFSNYLLSRQQHVPSGLLIFTNFEL